MPRGGGAWGKARSVAGTPCQKQTPKTQFPGLCKHSQTPRARKLHARSTFSHPDFTVGLGISPSLRQKAALAGFYRRSGIAAAPLTLPRRLLSVVARIISLRVGNVKF